MLPQQNHLHYEQNYLFLVRSLAHHNLYSKNEEKNFFLSTHTTPPIRISALPSKMTSPPALVALRSVPTRALVQLVAPSAFILLKRPIKIIIIGVCGGSILLSRKIISEIITAISSPPSLPRAASA